MALAPDPSDKLDAQADGAFGGKPVNRRAGYGDRLEMALKFAKKGACLSAGEGQLIVEHYEERLAAVEAERDRLLGEKDAVFDNLFRTEQERDAMESMYRHHVAVALDAIAKLNHAQAILAALREPSEAVSDAAFESFYGVDMPRSLLWAIRAAVTAAEDEVSHGARVPQEAGDGER